MQLDTILKICKEFVYVTGLWTNPGLECFKGLHRMKVHAILVSCIDSIDNVVREFIISQPSIIRAQQFSPWSLPTGPCNLKPFSYPRWFSWKIVGKLRM